MKLSTMNKDTIKLLLTCYLDRCKFIHSFAFLQFRKLKPDAKLTDLKEIFDIRKE